MLNTIFLFFTIVFFVGLSLVFTTRPDLAAENGLYESIQLVLIALAFVLALINLLTHKQKKLIYISIGFSLLSFGFFLRELELRDTDFPNWLIYLSSPSGSAVITSLLFLPFIVYSLRYLMFAWQSGLCFMKTNYFWLMLLAAVFLFTGGIFDRAWITDEYGLFFEEFFETAGYYTMLWALFKMTPQQRKYDASHYRKAQDYSCFD
ncbi:hypothetical protein [Thiomicrospira sp.]|uniref:hypothetical protein n=1 Tax=Thiomicrospira sp. TaxID=935 RepID=UPI002F93E234